MAKSGVLRNAVRADPRADDRETTAMLSSVGRLQGSGKTSVCFPNGTEVSLSASLSKVLQFSADELADGNAVTILASDVALSPGEAADLLGLSRPFVVRLLDDGSIPSQTQPQTRHRKVLLSDVSAFQAQRARKRAGRQRIMKIVEGNDLPY
jgi:excisionase family DNA binding protein